MPKIKYIDKRFRKPSREIVESANTIVSQYQNMGYDITLRQLYYQFIAKDLFPNEWIDRKYNLKHYLDPDTKNTDKNYKKLGGIINDARLAGLIDWHAITDRTRNLRSNSHWDNPRDILNSAAEGFAIDRWKNQEYRPECFIEKDALVGILQSACDPLDVPYFSCRGYTSVSELWVAAQRMKRWQRLGQTPVVIHLGDHDPSGIDMSRDVKERLELFGATPEFRRIALNWDQVQKYHPPPNPAKSSDSRFNDYQEKFGDESWELDALDPTTLVGLITETILEFQDRDGWERNQEEEQAGKEKLRRIYQRWDEISED